MQDPYFPHGVVNLRYALSCEPAHEKDIRIRTAQKTISLSAESATSRDEWVKAVRRVLFKAQHTGDNVKVAIPYSGILDVGRAAALDFSDMLEVKVVDAGGRAASEAYLFAHFADLPGALNQVRAAMRRHREQSGMPLPALPVKDTTQTSRTQPQLGSSPSRPGLSSRISSLWQRAAPVQPVGGMQAISEQAPPVPEEFTHVRTRGESSFVPVTEAEPSAEAALADSSHTYPPSPTPSETLGAPALPPSALSTWGVGMPSWLRITQPGAAHRLASDRTVGEGAADVPGHELGYSVLETPSVPVDAEMQEKFRSYFALSEEEALLGCQYSIHTEDMVTYEL
jgi:sterol 3beta-glucosyltransferase